MQAVQTAGGPAQVEGDEDEGGGEGEERGHAEERYRSAALGLFPTLSGAAPYLPFRRCSPTALKAWEVPPAAGVSLSGAAPYLPFRCFACGGREFVGCGDGPPGQGAWTASLYVQAPCPSGPSPPVGGRRTGRWGRV
ncbi:hypothetical protein SSP35_02_04670 [Streptomyces sp. NBRC 110611]|nr:hypothetical protein SSP35_02_04670 [Streptomyces sp. NBRC 110611]